MDQLFISYSRKDTDFARQLTESFTAKNMKTWVDWEDIPPSVDWMKEIEKGIEEADIFLFIVSPDSIHSSVCAEEVAHAVKNGKRILPVVAREVDMREAPSILTHLNWIFFSRPQDKFKEAFEKLLIAIHTDFDWVQTHARLQVKALEWERNNHEDSFLLRGKELMDAEAQLMVNGEKNPFPTTLQREYIVKSTEAEKEQVESQRAREQQLELERKLGKRLSRLTYLLLGIFTVAFIALFFWLNQVTSTLAINSIKDQMLALVETSVSFIDGNEFESFIKSFSADNPRVYQSDYYQFLEHFLDNIKTANKNIKTQMALYAVIKGEKAGEIYIVISTIKEIKFKTSIISSISNTVQPAQFAGLEKTVVNTEVYRDVNGSWISACSPIFNSGGRSIGALCADFNAGLLDDIRKKVTTTLAIAFLAIYPAMIALIWFATRSARKIKIRV